MIKRRKLLLLILVCFAFISFSYTNVFATDFWGQASQWFNRGNGIKDITTITGISEVYNKVSDMINVIGTSVIILVTITLGVKYIYGSVDSKSEIKGSLTSLLVACVFFFGWTSISKVLFPSGEFVLTPSTDTTYIDIVGRIFGIGTYILQFLVLVVIIYVGVKYIFSGASGKADLKGKSVQFTIGIIMVFATTNLLSYLSKVINEIL